MPFLRGLPLRRGAAILLTLFGGAALVFFAMKAAPGDPALAVLGENARPELVAAFRRTHNLDLPVLQQFTTWLGGALTGDFGRSLTLAGGVPVGQLIASRLPVTAFVGAYALLVAILVSLPIGTFAARNRGGALDTALTSLSVLGLSMPDFWLGYVLVFFFALSIPIFPSYGFVSPTQSIPGALLSGFLPSLAIAAPMAAIFARSLRAALLEIMHRPYVQVARSYGLSNGFIFRNYVLRNALIPYVTIIGLQIRYVMGGVVVIERVFGIPGIGSLMVDAAFGRDYPVIQACTITFLVVVMATNVAMDLLVTRLNPRARA